MDWSPVLITSHHENSFGQGPISSQNLLYGPIL